MLAFSEQLLHASWWTGRWRSSGAVDIVLERSFRLAEPDNDQRAKTETCVYSLVDVVGETGKSHVR